MRLMYTLLLQYDKSKYVDFDVFRFRLFQLVRNGLFFSLLLYSNKKKVPGNCYTQECSLSSWADRINAEKCILLLSCTLIHVVVVVAWFLCSGSSRGEDECQKQEARSKFKITQPEDDSCVCAHAHAVPTATQTSSSSRSIREHRHAEYDNRENETKKYAHIVHSIRCKKCLKKMQHNYVFRLHYLTYRMPVAVAISPWFWFSLWFDLCVCVCWH